MIFLPHTGSLFDISQGKGGAMDRPRGLLASLAVVALATGCSSADEEATVHSSDPRAPASPAGGSAPAGESASTASGSDGEDEPKMLDCLGEGSLVRPETLNLDCQNTNATLSHLEWNAWAVHGARGRGELSVNPCRPTCAEGRVENYAVTVAAPHAETSESGALFTEVEVRFTSKRPVGSTSREVYELPQ